MHRNGSLNRIIVKLWLFQALQVEAFDGKQHTYFFQKRLIVKFWELKLSHEAELMKAKLAQVAV
jgi:hypothetical protein